MPSTIEKNPDNTVRIFDRFYDVDIIVNSSEYDVVYSYFEGVSESPTIAGNFTSLLFRISQEAEINVLELLDVIKGQENKLQMNRVLAYYLNSFRSNVSLYGVGLKLIPNESIQRNVVI